MKKQLLTLLLAAITIGGIAQTKVIAHRGYWKTDGTAQNSIASLKKAEEIKAYGSEFDVKMTADGVLIVNHDDSLGGYWIETTPYTKLKDIKLKNGETLPTLDSYLATGKKNKHAKLILELKPHDSKEHENQAAAKTLAMVKKYRMDERVEYITFSLNAAKALMKNPKAHVSYLNGELSPGELKDLGFSGMDYHYSVYEKHPEWIREAQALGLIVNVWTVNDPDKMRYFIEQGADYITTDKPVELEKMINEK